MKNSEVVQLKMDLFAGVSDGILKEILKEDCYDFAISKAYSYMCNRYPNYSMGKIADLISQVFNSLFNGRTIEMIVEDVINEEIKKETLDELLEEDYFPYEG